MTEEQFEALLKLIRAEELYAVAGNKHEARCKEIVAEAIKEARDVLVGIGS